MSIVHRTLKQARLAVGDQSGKVGCFDEARLQAMKLMIEGIGPTFAVELTPDLLRLLYEATRHPNRFIRETSYHTLAAICSYSVGATLQGFGKDVAACLQDGLSENWSQVRRLKFMESKSLAISTSKQS